MPAVGMGNIMAMRLLAILVILWVVFVVWYIVEAGFVTLPAVW